MGKATAHVERLHAAFAGLPFLNSSFQARVQAADEPRELERLRFGFERAPLEAAKRAARAALLLFAQLTLILSSSVAIWPMTPQVPMSAPSPFTVDEDRPIAAWTSSALPQKASIT